MNTLGKALLFTGLVLAAGCSIDSVRVNAAPDPSKKPAVQATFDHSRLDGVLRQYVSAEGVVDYAKLSADRSDLDAYLASLAGVDPDKLGSKPEKLAFWINAYNAITLAGILHFYPTASIRDHRGFWDQVITNCGGVDRSLNDIEHRILRNMGEPRIHMAIVCAAQSCPRLRNEAYVAARLDAQLDDQARGFLASRKRNRFDDATKTAQLSKIFDWFAADFDAEPYGGVRGFVRKYAEPREWLGGEFAIDYLAYDWVLNGKAATEK